MEYLLELTDFWALLGEMSEDFAFVLDRTWAATQDHPQIWIWLTVWLGLFWICLRWSKIVADANDRRIYNAAETRLAELIEESRRTGLVDEAILEMLHDAPAEVIALAPPRVERPRGRRARAAHAES